MWPNKSVVPRTQSPQHTRSKTLGRHAGKSLSQSGLSVARAASLRLPPNSDLAAIALSSPRLQTPSRLREASTPTSLAADPMTVVTNIIAQPLNTSDNVSVTSQMQHKSNESDHVNRQLFQAASDDPHESCEQLSARIAGQYESDRTRLEELQKCVKTCDDVLASMEDSLARFQKDLGMVSAEIETLQNRSVAINSKLDKRKAAEILLGPVISDMAVAPSTVAKIVDGRIDGEWMSAIDTIEKKLQLLDNKAAPSSRSMAITEIKPLLLDLISVANGRIRDYLVAQIKALRSPNINAQVIQQTGLVTHKDLYAFLHRQHPQLAREIFQAYSNTMRWYYLSNFTRYRQALHKMTLYSIDKHDAIGVEPVAGKKGSGSTSVSSVRSSAPLTLGRRVETLTSAPDSALPSYVAIDSTSSVFLETPFHAFTTAVMDNASAEYSFLTAFFPSNTPYSELFRQFSNIFNPTFDLCNSFTKNLADNSLDCLGLLIGVRIVQHHAFTLQKRKCPAADGWVNGTSMLLWPRFQQAMDMHIESMKRSATQPGGSMRASSSTSSAKGGEGMSNTAPLPVTQRFAQFLHAILTLSSDAVTSQGDASAIISDTEPVGRSLERLRTEFDACLTRTAQGMNQSRRARFLDNNYSLIMTLIGDTTGPLAQSQKTWLEQYRTSSGSNQQPSSI